MRIPFRHGAPDAPDRYLAELEHICTGLSRLAEAVTLLRFRLERIDGRLEGLEAWLGTRTDYQPSAALARAGKPREDDVP